MMPLCSICPDGPPPSSGETAQIFSFALKALLELPCYSSGLISSHSLIHFVPGILASNFRAFVYVTPHLSDHPGFTLSPLPILLGCFAFLHLIHQPLTLFVMTNRIGLSHRMEVIPCGKNFPVLLTTASLVLSPQPDT